YTKNTHTYAVPQLNHNATSSVISNPPTAITYGTQTFTMIYGCNAGTVTENSTEGANTPVCNANYNWNGSSCTANLYTVTYSANGGGTPSPTTQSIAYNTAVGALATVTRTGYTFNGWFTATSGGTQITTATAVTAAVTWYAQWTLAAYSSAITYVAGDAFTYTLPSGSTVTVNVTGPGYGTVIGTKTLHTPACDTDDITIWQNGTNNVQVWAACNVGASVAVPYAQSNTVITTPYHTPTPTEKTRIGNFYQWGNRADITSAGTSASQVACTNIANVYNTAIFITVTGFLDWCSTGGTDNRWGNTDNTSIARQGPCPTGYHIPSAGTTDTMTEWGKAYTIANGMSTLGTCSQTTGTQPYDRLRCAIMI
ncbi:MAG: InlB B-repeat-containing protein, partial [Candidatus Gracilibacteria bacterium]|nr:InlB B-repeat-containing protein [Candidatus Gracilibacteria bacterium]